MIFEPLYSPDLGLVGFRCRCGACTRVVRTQRGIKMHCIRVHGIMVQMELPGMEKQNVQIEIKQHEESHAN